MIEFKSVKKSFGARTILNGISFQIDVGEIIFIIGKSGMGKSVLLKNIVGLLRPDSGEIWVDGEEVTRLGEEEYLQVRRRCGMVFQSPALLDSLSVFDNIAFGPRSHGIDSNEELTTLVGKMLKLVGLGEEVGARFPAELSFGMQKRVSLARTLALEPRYLLYDEPTTGLDPVTTAQINDLIVSLSRKLECTSIVVSHDMQCAIEIADRIFMLDQGGIVAAGTPKEILKCDVPLVKAFMTESGVLT